jgi:hypothetical protein
MYINIDKIDTFPNNILNYISDNFTTIEKYGLETKRINDLYDFKDKFIGKHIINRYENAARNIINNMPINIKELDFIYYHCTKLLNNEIEYLINNGLYTLSYQLVDKKLQFLEDSNILEKRKIDFLRKNNHNHNSIYPSSRNGFVFVTNKKILESNSPGLKFLKYWGGENFYFYNNNQNMIELSKIGISSIVKIKINFENDKNDLIKKNIAFTMVKSFYETKIEGYFLFSEYNQKYEFPLTKSVLPNDIIGIITYNNPEFKILIGDDFNTELKEYNFML